MSAAAAVAVRLHKSAGMVLVTLKTPLQLPNFDVAGSVRPSRQEYRRQKSKDGFLPAPCPQYGSIDAMLNRCGGNRWRALPYQRFGASAPPAFRLAQPRLPKRPDNNSSNNCRGNALPQPGRAA